MNKTKFLFIITIIDTIAIIILTIFLISSSFFDGAHYVAAKISKEGKFLVYNNGSRNVEDVNLNKFNHTIIGGDLIAAYIIE